MTDVEEIARRMTEAQREAVRSGELAESPEVFSLARQGLAWKMADHIDLVTGAHLRGGWQLRPLGLAVRAHLEQEQTK